MFSDNSNKHGCFSIDKTTGNISVSCPYDREDREFYSLTIKVMKSNHYLSFSQLTQQKI